MVEAFQQGPRLITKSGNQTVGQVNKSTEVGAVPPRRSAARDTTSYTIAMSTRILDSARDAVAFLKEETDPAAPRSFVALAEAAIYKDSVPWSGGIRIDVAINKSR